METSEQCVIFFHQNKVWYLFKKSDPKVNNKDTRTDSTHCSGASIVYFEQVNTGWSYHSRNLNSEFQYFPGTINKLKIKIGPGISSIQHYEDFSFEAPGELLVEIAETEWIT